jgi:hypothetical protein
MRKRVRISVVLVSWLAATVVSAHVAVAQTAGSAGGSPTDSPYKTGPPAVTGGYTDTSQGGSKTSGDMPVAPPSAGGQDKAAKSGQQQKGPDSQQHTAPQGEKAKTSDSRG